MLRANELFLAFPLTPIIDTSHCHYRINANIRLPFGYWQAICYYIFMILLYIRMKVLSEKRMELSQTIASLSGSIRMEKGCRRCDFCQSIEDGNRIFLLEEWDTEESLKTHLESDNFRVLRGAMNLLKEPYKMTFHNVIHLEGREDI